MSNSCGTAIDRLQVFGNLHVGEAGIRPGARLDHTMAGSRTARGPPPCDERTRASLGIHHREIDAGTCGDYSRPSTKTFSSSSQLHHGSFDAARFIARQLDFRASRSRVSSRDRTTRRMAQVRLERRTQMRRMVGLYVVAALFIMVGCRKEEPSPPPAAAPTTASQPAAATPLKVAPQHEPSWR